MRVLNQNGVTPKPSRVRIETVIFFSVIKIGTSLAVQWLRLCASSAGGVGSIPGCGTKIPHVTQCGPNKKTKTPNPQKSRKITIVNVYFLFFCSHFIF